MKPLRSGKAFTLVELLVVIMILSIMGGMVVTAVRGVTNTARLARTRSIIEAIDSVIQEHYESYKYRPLPIAMPNYSKDVTAGSPPVTVTWNLEVLASEAARVRLIMTRDLQRMEMPDKRLDVVNTLDLQLGPMPIRAVANRVVEGTDGSVIRKFDERDEFLVTWNPPTKNDTYFERFRSNNSNWTEEHEGAECLYLIMATSFSGGKPAISVIPSSNIDDTDEDGMLEILDGWGNPLGFVRWPVGYSDPSGTLDGSGVALDKLKPDDFDPFRADFGFIVSTIDEPWSLRPLIVSAGSDGEFGVSLSGSTNYRAQTWPVADMNTGTTTLVLDEKTGRDISIADDMYPFPDPYLRHTSLPLLPGQRITGSDSYADNVSNFSLRVTP